MSSEALAAFWRHEFDSRLDGTAAAILLYFAIRHDEKLDAAYPGLKKICKDLSMSRGQVVEGISRLEKKFGLVDVNRCAGIRRTNVYKLPWIRQGGSAGPDRTGGSAGPDLEGSGGADPGGVRCTDERGQVEPSKPVRPARLKNIKTLKQILDQVTQPITDSERHEISTACVSAGIGDCDWGDITTQASKLGHNISTDELKEIQDKMRDLRQSKPQRVTQ